MAVFSGKRKMTIGVNAEVPPAVQIAMWVMLNQDITSGKKMDYLQIFELKPVMENGKLCQEITYSQEQPRRKRKMTVPVDDDFVPISERVFIIDSEGYVTMMLASEY